MHLASRVLQLWRQQAQQVLELEARAFEVGNNRNIIIGMNIFDRWRARTDELAELESVGSEKVLRKHLFTWKYRLANLQKMQFEAITSFEERTQSRFVRKWSLQTLQLQVQFHYASDVREKNKRKTFRRIFTYWQQRTAQKRPVKPSQLVDNKPNRESSFGQLGNTARAEAWSDFGDELEIDELAQGLDENNTSTPIPGYMNTPSKRTEKVKAAVARVSSTTPRAPLPTPFERHLRAQYSGGALPSQRKALGRSTLRIGGGFTDIIGRGMNDDQESRALRH